MINLDEIKKACDAATPGPWKIDPKYRQVWAPRTGEYISTEAERPEDPEANFIANSRQWVPDLVAELERLRAENAELRSCLEFYADKSTYVSRSGKIGVNPIYTEDCEPYSPYDEYPGAAGKRARALLSKLREGAK